METRFFEKHIETLIAMKIPLPDTSGIGIAILSIFRLLSAKFRYKELGALLKLAGSLSLKAWRDGQFLCILVFYF